MGLENPMNYNDSVSVSMSPEQWYRNTCDTYEVILAFDFELEEKDSTCISIGGSLGASKTKEGGLRLSGEAKFNAEYKSCSDWTDPAQSYIWYAKVAPV